MFPHARKEVDWKGVPQGEITKSIRAGGMSQNEKQEQRKEGNYASH